MATVIFYEKPGCGNNTKQKALLVASGHKVLVKDLLKEKWRKEELRPFFGALSVAQWFNPSAPRIKSGEVNPVELDADTAIAMMIKEPLLIRRPLMKVGDICRAGFDENEIRAWLGLNNTKPAGDLESCPNGHAAQRCPSPVAEI
jgi:nitrogenase-associated protein